MEIFCTYCSKEKDQLIDLLPAIHRYKSKRIRKVNEAAKSIGIPMFILSGEYGLISSKIKIPYYDHLLKGDEVESLSLNKVQPQLREIGIRKIYFFLNPTDPHIKPYIDTISNACRKENVEIILINISLPEYETARTKGYREIWYSSLMSNQRMVQINDKNASVFNKLLQEHPNDGMIFYQRAEAFENLGELRSAKNDYENALLYFPNPKWKRVAYEGLKRIQKDQGALKRSGELNKHWNYFHKTNSYVFLPHIIRVYVLSALERFEEEQRLAVGELRICLEMLILNLSRNFNTVDKNYHKDIDVSKKIRNLRKAGCGDSRFCDALFNCWRKMGEIIHPIKYVDLLDIDYDIAVESFLNILQKCNEEKLCLLEKHFE